MSLESELLRLESAELVRRVYDEEWAYWIKHALVQETARGSLLLNDRKRLNRLVGECLERLYADRLDELAVPLARHFESAGDEQKSYAYWMRAAERALHQNAQVETNAHLDKALAAAERAGIAPREVYLMRGRAAEQRGDFQAALATYQEMQALGVATGDRAQELAAIVAQATIQAIPSPAYNPEVAQALCDTALLLAHELGDVAAETKVLWTLMLLYSRVGMGHAEAVQVGEQALALAEAHDLAEQRAYILNDMAPLFIFLGQVERGRAANLEARAYWRETNNLSMYTDNLSYAMMGNVILGEYDAAIENSDEAYRISVEIGNRWGAAFARTWIGLVLFERGEVAQALQVMEWVLTQQDAFPPVVVLTQVDLARAYADLGAVEYGRMLANNALEAGRERFPGLVSSAEAMMGHILLMTGDLDGAAEMLKGIPPLLDPNQNPLMALDGLGERLALAVVQKEWKTADMIAANVLPFLREAQMLHYLILTLRFHAPALVQRKRLDEASAELAEAQAVAESIGAVWNLWQIHAAASAIETARKNVEAAEQHRVKAREYIEFIAARTPDGPSPAGVDLRATFLATPAVRAVLEDAPKRKPRTRVTPAKSARAKPKPKRIRQDYGDGVHRKD